MSFGFSVGDFLTIIQLAQRVIKSCEAAPKTFQDITGEVRRLHIVLKKTQEVIAASSQNVGPDLQRLAAGCQEVLVDVETLLEKFEGLRSGRKNSFSFFRKDYYDRLRWDHEDVADLRARIMTNTSLMIAFNTSCQRCASDSVTLQVR